MARAAARETYLALLLESDAFLQRALSHMVNHRIQNFADPLTQTLVLMATTPAQMVLCESGLLLLRTNQLPVIPYTLLSKEERAALGALIRAQPPGSLHETVEPSGQYTLTVLPSSDGLFLHRERLLLAFVELLSHAPRANPAVNRTLCHIIFQRFVARVTTPTDVQTTVVNHIDRLAAEAVVVVDDPATITTTTIAPT
jgi:hypothetical protein